MFGAGAPDSEGDASAGENPTPSAVSGQPCCSRIRHLVHTSYATCSTNAQRARRLIRIIRERGFDGFALRRGRVVPVGNEGGECAAGGPPGPGRPGDVMLVGVLDEVRVPGCGATV